MKITFLSTLFAIILFAMPSPSQADSFMLDYNADSYSSSITGTFFLPADYGLVTSANFSILVAGHRTYTNSRGYSWYYDNLTDLTVGSQQIWDNNILSGNFSFFTFSLDQDSLDALNTNKEISFNLLGESAYWNSDLSPWGGYSASRFYLDYAQLDVTATPIPGAIWLLGSGFVGLLGLRRKLS